MAIVRRPSYAGLQNHRVRATVGTVVDRRCRGLEVKAFQFDRKLIEAYSRFSRSFSSIRSVELRASVERDGALSRDEAEREAWAWALNDYRG